LRNVRDVQYNKVIELYQYITKMDGRVPSIGSIRNLSSEVLYSTERTPLSGNYRIEPYKVPDMKALNAELGLIKADAETIFEYLDIVQERMRGLRYISEIWESYVHKKIELAVNEISKIVPQGFVDGFTNTLDIVGLIDKDNTSLEISDNGRISLQVVSSEDPYYEHTETDITIKKIGPLGAITEGDPVTVVNNTPSSGIVMTLVGTEIIESGFIFILNTDMKGINYLSLQLKEVNTGLKIEIECTSNKRDYTKVYSSLIKRNLIEFPIPRQDISQVKIYMTMDMPNLIQPGSVSYRFKMQKFSMLRTNRRASGTFQTTKLSISEDISKLSLVTSEEVTGEGNIKYYISTSEDSSGVATGFSLIEANSNNFMDLGNITVPIYVAVPENGDSNNLKWNIRPENKYGQSLYNILDCGYEISTSDYSIGNGVLTCDNIIDANIKLYRGCNDYVKVLKEHKQDKHISKISHKVEINTETNWVNPISFRLEIEEIVEENKITNNSGLLRNRIELTYPLKNFDNIRIKKEDGVEFYAEITDISEIDNVYYITFGAIDDTITVLDPLQSYRISYITSIEDYSSIQNVTIDIDMTSVKVFVYDEELTEGEDFIIYPSEYMVELLKSGAFYEDYDEDETAPEATNVNVEFSFTETQSSITYYETMIYVTTNTDITILPFTGTEITSGNFHIIDKINVSSYTEYTLKYGWHIIQTTNPYPSYNENDINEFTGIASSAGIIFPATITTMRPYIDSMRRVSPFKLSTLGKVEGAKCFAFENGKIYINFIPDFIDPVIVTNIEWSNTKGKFVICKNPTYSETYENEGYNPQPEIFMIELSFRSDDTDRFIYLRGVIDMEDNVSIATIDKIGINEFEGGE